MVTKAVKLPKTIGATIDLLFTMQKKREAIEETISLMKEQEAAVEAYLRANFKTEDLEGSRGKLAQAVLKHSTVAEVEDWDKIYLYVAKNKAFDLFQKRLSITALRARWDEKKIVPGVTPKDITTFSVKAVKS